MRSFFSEEGADVFFEVCARAFPVFVEILVENSLCETIGATSVCNEL